MALSVSYVGSVFDDANASTYTFTAADLGSADAGKVNFCAVHWGGATGVTLSSATIDGVGATIHVQHEAAAGARSAAIISAAVSSASGNIVLNFSGTTNRGYVGVYRVLGMDTVEDSDFDDSLFVGLTQFDLTTSAGGAVIAAQSDNATGPTRSWNLDTEDYDIARETNSAFSGAHSTGLAGGTLSVACDETQTVSIAVMVAVAISAAASGGFQAAWARNANTILGTGIRAA